MKSYNSCTKRTGWIWHSGVMALALLSACFINPTVANAQASPPGCSANRLGLDVQVSPITGVDGQTFNYTVNIFNNPLQQADACDADQIEVRFRCPAADGSPTGPAQTLATNVSLPADGSGDTTYPPIPCVVDVNPGVTVATAFASMGDDDGVLDELNLGRLLTDPPQPFTVGKQLPVTIQSCLVKIDKQVSCDGGLTWIDDDGFVFGNEDGTDSQNCVTGEPLLVRWAAQNVGETNLFSCNLSETNPSFTDPAAIGNILAGESTPFFTDDTQTCNDATEAGEPDTASVSCFCLADLNEDFKTSASDSLNFECNAPGLAVTKECLPQEQGINQVNINVTNTGDVTLENCVVTDTLADNTPVIVDPSIIASLAPGESVPVTGQINDLQAEILNSVHVVCDVAGTGQTIDADANDLCEAGQGCLTRTPGFWGTHPDITAQFLPLDSCGLSIDDKTEALQDICSVGKDAKTVDTSPQQVQLIRQCMAANLNIAATTFLGGSCESEVPGITLLIDECCNGPDPVCNSDSTASEISTSNCIESLDTFNNLPDDIIGEPFTTPGPASPKLCSSLKNDGVVNPGRDLGPGK